MYYMSKKLSLSSSFFVKLTRVTWIDPYWILIPNFEKTLTPPSSDNLTLFDAYCEHLT